MKKTLLFSCLMLVFGTVASYSQSCHGEGGEMDMYHSQHKNTPKNNLLKVQTICPVMKNPIDIAIYADWEGDENNTPKRVYFCCPMCIDIFKSNPAKYIKKLRKMHQPIENIFPQKSLQQG